MTVQDAPKDATNDKSCGNIDIREGDRAVVYYASVCVAEGVRG